MSQPGQVITELPPQKELKVGMLIPEYDLVKAKKKMDSIFKVRANMKEDRYVRVDDDDPEDEEEEQKEKEGEKQGSETSSLKTDLVESGEDEEDSFRPPAVEFYQSDSEKEEDNLVKLQDYYVLGMVGTNKELLLFDRQIQMNKKIEEWLQIVEDSMRISVKKHMKNGILRFSNQPIEEWILDYPQ